MIRAYIITQIPGSPDVRDILQEVNVVLWEKRGTFKEGTNFGAWACTVARYKVLEHRRKEARHAGLFLFNDELSEFLGEKFQNHPPNFLEEHRQALEHCLPQLSEKTANSLALVTLRAKEGLKNTLAKQDAPMSPCELPFFVYATPVSYTHLTLPTIYSV